MFPCDGVFPCEGPCSPSLEFKELLENERNNLRLVNTAAAFLGGVPAMINPADMSNTIPSEKVGPAGLRPSADQLFRDQTPIPEPVMSFQQRNHMKGGASFGPPLQT